MFLSLFNAFPVSVSVTMLQRNGCAFCRHYALVKTLRFVIDYLTAVRGRGRRDILLFISTGVRRLRILKLPLNLTTWCQWVSAAIHTWST